MFDVEDIQLTYTRALSHYDKDPIKKYMTHLSVPEMVIHLWRRVLKIQDNFEKVYYSSVSEGSTNHLGWRYENNKISRVPITNVCFGTAPSGRVPDGKCGDWSRRT